MQRFFGCVHLVIDVDWRWIALFILDYENDHRGDRRFIQLPGWPYPVLELFSIFHSATILCGV